MTTRYLFKNELSKFFDKDILPTDIEKDQVIGVTEVSSYSLIIEEEKIASVPESLLSGRHQNVLKENNNNGRIWILDLNAQNLSRLLLNEDFYCDYCDKKTNPLELCKRISLYYDDSYSFWSDNVYIEAFE